jgi:POTRA domain-containing FtsQ-type protein
MPRLWPARRPSGLPNAPRRIPPHESVLPAYGAARPLPPASGMPWRGMLTTAVGGALAAAALVGGVALYRSDALRVHHIEVLGTEIVDPAAAAAAAHVSGDSLISIDTEAAAARVSALPGVAAARVHRDWPQGVVLDITERQGWGYWQVLGVRTVIDAEGRVVDKARPPAPGAPTINEVGAGAPLDPGASVDRDAVAVVTRLTSDGTFATLGAQSQRFDFERSRGLVVRIASGPAAVFGDSHDYEFKVAAWAALNARVKAGEVKATEIDLRFGRELVVR